MGLSRLKVVFRLFTDAVLAGYGMILLITGCTGNQEVLPFYNTADFTPEWIAPGTSAYPLIHKIDTFSMQDQLGHVFNSDSLTGKIYVANFFFTTCPGICPKMANNLKRLQDTFLNNDQVKLISFSVMPWVDSVSKLRDYGDVYNIQPFKWHLLTGSKQRIYTLGRKSFFAERNQGIRKDTSAFLHTESMLLIDKKSRIRGIYDATQITDVNRITADIEILLKE